jgi:hypothetical protein
VDYIEILRAIRRIRGLRTLLPCLPIPAFALLLRGAAWVSKKPPFTIEQLNSLTVGDDFDGVDMRATFNVTPTPLEDGLRETLLDPRYSGVRMAPNL